MIFSADLIPCIRRFAVVCSLGGVLLAAGGCATTGSDATPARNGATSDTTGKTQATTAAQPAPEAKIVLTPQQIGDATLTEGVALFDKGDFNGSVRLLQGTPEVWTSSVDTRMRAYKVVAFSQCISNRRQPCRAAFDELLKLNPAFELSAAEAGHPMWGPVFKQAKRDAQKQVHSAAATTDTRAHTSKKRVTQ